MPLVWRDSSTIPAGLEKYLYFKVGADAGDSVRVLLIAFSNDTRPQADPRPAFAWKGANTSEHGDEDTDGIIAMGHVCSYGDIIQKFPRGLELDQSEQIGFKYIGENGDAVTAKVLYEVI